MEDWLFNFAEFIVSRRPGQRVVGSVEQLLRVVLKGQFDISDNTLDALGSVEQTWLSRLFAQLRTKTGSCEERLLWLCHRLKHMSL